MHLRTNSSCDTPLSKFLKLTILASNVSSSSTKLTQDQKGLFKVCNRVECKGVKKCVAKDQSTQLVWITDALGDPLFGQLHRLSALSFNIFATLELWARLRSFGDSSNALGDPQAFFSSSFQPFCSFLPSSVHALPQTPNT
ncbi:hypothetical protein H5410_021230 [Solanum commersonii]|uniref:Uncharacterized protein n=1 Tax=Solanum commersonii TaxID=4109 RepID=A0A9J5ZC18_SOLCO|nr:hypothetical protein H5410_021230 [Solanum commersonii]